MWRHFTLYVYTVSGKGATTLLPLADRFSKFFDHQSRPVNLYKTDHGRSHPSLNTSLYTTLWNVCAPFWWIKMNIKSPVWSELPCEDSIVWFTDEKIFTLATKDRYWTISDQIQWLWARPMYDWLFAEVVFCQSGACESPQQVYTEMTCVRSTARSVIDTSQAAFHYHVVKRGTLWHCSDFSVWYTTRIMPNSDRQRNETVRFCRAGLGGAN